MPERDVDSGLLYNAAVLIGPDGVIGTHRKSHSYIAEPKWAAPGNHGHQVFDTAVGRIAVLICMDLHFIETGRLVGLEGADVICHLSNWLAERTPAPYWISRAYENASYLIESNRWGLERGVQFSGGSCVIGPDARSWRAGTAVTGSFSRRSTRPPRARPNAPPIRRCHGAGPSFIESCRRTRTCGTRWSSSPCMAAAPFRQDAKAS